MRSFQQNSRYQNTVGEVQKLLQMYMTLRNLSKDVFQRRVSTGNDALSHLTCLNATKIVLLSVLCLAEHLGKTTAHWCKKPTSGCKNPTSGCKNPTSGWRAPCLSCLLPAGSATSQRTFSALWRLNFVVKRTQKRQRQGWHYHHRWSFIRLCLVCYFLHDYYAVFFFFFFFFNILRFPILIWPRTVDTESLQS